tara:strand:- start:57 stop:554 length:498 start_codon:yes stop_codon:yes gene_type:complete
VLENILIGEEVNNCCAISYKNSKNEKRKLVLKTPMLYLPFGFDKTGKDLFLNVQLRKTKNPNYNKELESFEQFIQQLEDLIKTTLKKEINSQIRYSEKYDPIISLKVKMIKNKINTEVKQKNSFFNFYKITKGMSLESEIIIDNVWIYNDKIYYKIKLEKINISV